MSENVDATNTGSGVAEPPGVSEERLREMIAQHLAGVEDRLDQEVRIEGHVRSVIDQLLEKKVADLIVRERMLEKRVGGVLGRQDPRMLERQQQLDQLARSLLGPQELLERAGSPPGNPDPATGPIGRPPFEQEPAHWSVPRIPPTGPDNFDP